MAAWQPRVSHVEDGEPVTGGVDSRPTRELEARTNYLKDAVDLAELGEALFARDVPVEPEARAGQPVYWNAAAARFERAWAAAELDPETGALAAADSARVVGVVYAKHEADRATLVLAGRATLALGEALAGEEGLAGFYYLGRDPGVLVRTRVPAGPLVLFADGLGEVYVQPSQDRFAQEHAHVRLALACAPAGVTTPPEPGGRHVVLEADPGRAGWLPASHASFGGRAPRGAAFGYNLAAHPALDRAWPPVPLAAASLVWDKGDGGGGRQVALGSGGLVVVDRHGIWWMSDCYGDVPWPALTNTSVSSSLSSQGSTPECPRDESMSLVLAYSVDGAAGAGVVRSLVAAEGTAAFVRSCDGATAAEAGDLEVGVATAEGPVDHDTVWAVKSVSPGLDAYRRGVVATGLVAEGDAVSLSGSHQRTQDGRTVHAGVVTVRVDLEPGGRELVPTVVKLVDARERVYDDVLTYIGLLEGQESGFLGRLPVPASGVPDDPTLTVKLRLLARAAGTLPDLTLSWRRLAAAGSATALPTSDAGTQTISLGQTVAADEYLDVEAEAFTVAAGDTVAFTLTRASDSYAGELGVIEVLGVLRAGG